MENITGSIVVASYSTDEGPSSSSTEEVHDEVNILQDQGQNQDQQNRRQRHQSVFYRFNVSIFRGVPPCIRDEAWSACFVLTSFWIFGTFFFYFYFTYEIVFLYLSEGLNKFELEIEFKFPA